MGADGSEKVNLYALIMAGGRGTRFWPASTKRRPKQLLKIGKSSLLRLTFERIAPLFPKGKVFVFTSREIVGDVIKELPEVPKRNVIAEPVAKNTAPAIALCAQLISLRSPDGIMAVFPSDHYIKEAKKFRDIVLAAARFANKGDALVTFGIKPRYPATGYGYLEFGERVAMQGGHEIFKLSRFVEKPRYEKAVEFVKSNNYFWNSGVFVWRASSILKNVEKFLPKTFDISRKIAQARNFNASLNKNFKNMDSISVDYGVMEKSDNVYGISADIIWNDLGSWEAFYEVMEKGECDSAVCAGELVSIDSKNILTYSQDKIVAAIGVNDLVIVATDRAVLVCKKSESQRVREVVSILEEKKKSDLL